MKTKKSRSYHSEIPVSTPKAGFYLQVLALCLVEYETCHQLRPNWEYRRAITVYIPCQQCDYINESLRQKCPVLVKKGAILFW